MAQHGKPGTNNVDRSRPVTPPPAFLLEPAMRARRQGLLSRVPDQVTVNLCVAVWLCGCMTMWLCDYVTM
jgi:hypothetical protein